MGTNSKLRAPGAATLAAGVLATAVPATAVALTSGTANAQPSQTSALRVDGIRHHVRYGSKVTVRGQLPAADAGQRVALEFEPAGSTAWRKLTMTTAGGGGRFALHTRVRRSGLVRVVDISSQASAAAAAVGPGSGPIPPSEPAHIAVAAGFRIDRPQRAAVAGRPIALRGRLLPGSPGRVVRLITLAGNHWQTLTRARTGRHGRFTLHYTPQAGTRWLRVAFRGDQTNRGTWAAAGSVSGLMYRVASWYSDGGQTACGFHAYYGVANKSLPCGTKVTMSYGGRTVVATVDDRGPYVAGRTYDLNQNVASALGMYGVATILASR